MREGEIERQIDRGRKREVGEDKETEGWRE